MNERCSCSCGNWQYWKKVVTFCCNLTSISIIRKCVCYCSCNGVQKCQTVEVTHHNNKQLREKKPLTSLEVLVIEQVVKWSFDFEVHTQYWWCALHSAVHTRLRLGILDRSYFLSKTHYYSESWQVQIGFSDVIQYVCTAVMSSNPHLQQQQILTQLLTRTPTHTIQTWNLNIDLHARPVPRSSCSVLVFAL